MIKPALLDSGHGIKEPVYVVEERSDGLSVVIQPWSPTAFAGSVRIVPADQLQILSTTLDEFPLAITHFGLGMSGTLGQQSKN